MNISEPVVVFDGICNFCSYGVLFILKNDRSGKLQFAPVQSAYGARLLHMHGISSLDPSTFLFVVKGRGFTKSDAAIKISSYLGPWKVLQVCRFLPRKVRDFAYDIVARNRYRLFGKRDTCFIPTAKDRNRFIND